jgi:predicted naringenin-chalcone synthase
LSSKFISLATALPEHRLEPARALAELRRYWPRIERIEATRAELGTRYTCEPVDQLLRQRGLTELRTSYLEHAGRLAGTAARRALAGAGISGREVDLVVTVSCTGYLVPSLDVHLAAELGLRPDVIRVPITELGCSGGAAAIALAHRHLLAFPDQRVLVIAVEVPSLNFQTADRSLDNLTACLVFGDGAGAAVIGGGTDRGIGLQVLRTASHLVPGTADVLGFDLRDGGFHVVLDRRLPRVLARELRPVVDDFKAAANLGAIDFVAAHAAGPRIFDAVADALQWAPDALELSREVFATVGNTSSAAIFFSLERLVKSGIDPGEGLGLGLGPGVTIELMHLAWTPSENARDEAGALAERLPVGR